MVNFYTAYYGLFGVILVVSYAITIIQIRIELGLSAHDFEGMDCRMNLPLLFGSSNLGARNLTSSVVNSKNRMVYKPTGTAFFQRLIYEAFIRSR